MKYELGTKKTFTLLELLIVLIVIGFLTAMIGPRFAGIGEDAAVTTALNEMKSIKEAVRDRFYPDLGLIPEDTANPEYAIRYLCLKDDGVGGNEYQEMLTFLTVYGKAGLVDWDKYSRKGWHGYYMERETVYEAISGPPPVYFPLIADAWKNPYLIIGGQDRAKARIVSLGANGVGDGGETTSLPLPADTGDDLVMFIFGTEPVRRP